MNAIVPRDTLAEIVGYRNKAIELYEIAHTKIIEAADAEKAAAEMSKRAFPGANSSYTHSNAEEIKRFFAAVGRPDRDGYLRTARRLIDLNVWAWIVERTDLEALMDKEAKDQLRKQMAYVPERTGRSGELINGDEIEAGMPPVTVENIVATLEKFQGEAEMIFRRGVANAFAKLDRRFKSHDGFKVGARMILDGAFGDYGWSYHRNHRDSLVDIERAFLILDGKGAKATYAGIVGKVDAERGRTSPHQSEHAGDYFKVRIFQNGNAHLWFTRPDLLRKVNKLLGEWYGEVVGDGQATEEDPLASPKTSLARNFGFFPTPDDAVAKVIERAKLYRYEGAPTLTVLEPSAGTGNLAHAAKREGAVVDCVEVQPALADALRAQNYRRVMCMDFLKHDPVQAYDRVIMNPPFDRERDIDHVVHALKFLKADGRLVAIMSAGTEFRETKKSVAFRELVRKMGGSFTDLPAGSFSSVGTNVNTVILTLNKDGRHPHW